MYNYWLGHWSYDSIINSNLFGLVAQSLLMMFTKTFWKIHRFHWSIEKKMLNTLYTRWNENFTVVERVEHSVNTYFFSLVKFNLNCPCQTVFLSRGVSRGFPVAWKPPWQAEEPGFRYTITLTPQNTELAWCFPLRYSQQFCNENQTTFTNEFSWNPNWNPVHAPG